MRTTTSQSRCRNKYYDPERRQDWNREKEICTKIALEIRNEIEIEIRQRLYLFVGNLKVMGQIVHPSDVRAKHNIEELDTAQQLRNVQSIRVVKFDYDKSFAQHSGLLGFDPTSSTPHSDTGVIAQELRQVLPEAVKEAGDVQLPNGDTINKFLVVNKDRIFMENLGAVKELCKVTGKLESRIDHLERINKKLCKINILQRRDSAKSSISNDSRFSRLSTTNSSKSFYSDNISIEHIRDIARNIRRQECCQKLSHNSPKYHRKQCRSCREYSTYSKYGKFYNNNKTNSVKYNNSSEEAKIDGRADASEPHGAVDSPVFDYGGGKKETCIWLRNVESESNFSCGNTKLVFCCRKARYDDGNELISNKLLQIVITVLIFIMAVCLVVMSALYFKEHQELILLNEKLRPHRNYDVHHQYGKFSMPSTLHGHTGTTVHDTGYHQNSIQKGKAGSQQIIPKKPTKEKGPHKTTQEYITTAGLVTSENLPYLPTISTQPVPTLKTPAMKRKNNNPYVETQHLTPPHDLESEPADPKPKSFTRTSTPIGRPAVGCSVDNTVPSEDDEDCPTPCCLDSRQVFDNSDPLERNQQIREVTNSTPYFFPSRRNVDNPQIPPTKEKSINVVHEPEILDRNSSDAMYKNKNHSIDNIQDEGNMAESNLVDDTKIFLKDTNNETKRFRRQLSDAAKSAEEKTNYQLSDKSDETDCDTIVFAINSKSFSNDSIFAETLCSGEALNLTYNIPVSRYMRDGHIDITFKSTKIKGYELCDSYCKQTQAVGCKNDEDVAKPFPENSNIFRLSVECKIDRVLTIKASEENGKPSPCQDVPLNLEQFRPLVQYNIHVYRDCHN
ncbi:Myelin regulatory factor [Eumeta japonica]|uniref:Myelin regulatory factor n=1 Tax=Eumeta variegata TaxID=151549 RepID=A0A4C1U2G5_EUMVA|nr:Myelin regulatory factor [Eumeta japonica]